VQDRLAGVVPEVDADARGVLLTVEALPPRVGAHQLESLTCTWKCSSALSLRRPTPRRVEPGPDHHPVLVEHLALMKNVPAVVASENTTVRRAAILAWADIPGRSEPDRQSLDGRGALRRPRWPGVACGNWLPSRPVLSGSISSSGAVGPPPDEDREAGFRRTDPPVS